jgi:hypothetical protein
MMAESEKLMAVFEQPTNTAEAIDSLVELGVEEDKITVMTGVPYPEHAIGRHVEWIRLPYIVLAGAAGGFLFGLFLAVITPHLYRLDVGGHPQVGFPPTAVIIFVFTMMATIVSTFFGVLWEMNFPEFSPKYYHELVTDGYLAVLVEFSPNLEERVRRILDEHGVYQVERAEKKPL